MKRKNKDAKNKDEVMRWGVTEPAKGKQTPVDCLTRNDIQINIIMFWTNISIFFSNTKRRKQRLDNNKSWTAFFDTHHQET